MPTLSRKKSAPGRTDTRNLYSNRESDRYGYSGCSFIADPLGGIAVARPRKGKLIEIVYMPKWTDLPGGGGILEFACPSIPARKTHTARSRRDGSGPG